jgi:aldehyde dehydrogenase (NAD+)
LELPFHHVFFTGSPAVGKIVMSAAAKNLASVTLELGGKSPAVIDDRYDLKDAAKKIVWGKLLNIGQTCVAPDYVLVPENHAADFVRRLQDLLKNAVETGARVEIDAGSDETTLSFGPVILSNVPRESAILNEEIFGPILPVVSYRTVDEAVDFIHSKPRPLSLYIFSKNRQRIETMLQRTHSGGVCINDVAVHFVDVELPFGGINNSGIGNSHGYFGFRAFSHERAILRQPKRGVMTFFYPPYKENMKKLIQWTIKYL